MYFCYKLGIESSYLVDVDGALISQWGITNAGELTGTAPDNHGYTYFDFTIAFPTDIFWSVTTSWQTGTKFDITWSGRFDYTSKYRISVFTSNIYSAQAFISVGY